MTITPQYLARIEEQAARVIEKLGREVTEARAENKRLRAALKMVKREFDSGRVNSKLGEIVNAALAGSPAPEENNANAS